MIGSAVVEELLELGNQQERAGEIEMIGGEQLFKSDEGARFLVIPNSSE